MNDIFEVRCNSDFILLAKKLWDSEPKPLRTVIVLIPTEIKNVSFLENIKRGIKKWKEEKCPWRICKTYLQNIDFTRIQAS